MPIEREVLLKRIEYLDGVVVRWMEFVKGIVASYLTPAGFSVLLSLFVKPLPQRYLRSDSCCGYSDSYRDHSY